jgi:TRAP-type C4-dicarboxylate transport system permease small subunit
LAVKESRHLTMDILTSFLPAKFKPYMSFVVYLFVLVVISLLFRVSWMYAIEYKIPFENQEMLFPWLAKAYLSVIFPISFALMFVHYIFKILELFAGIKNTSEAPKLH